MVLLFSKKKITIYHTADIATYVVKYARLFGPLVKGVCANVILLASRDADADAVDAALLAGIGRGRG